MMNKGIPELGGYSPEVQEAKEKFTSLALDTDLEVDDVTLKKMPGILKWTFDLNKGDEHYSKKATQAQLTGIVRGLITERISHLVPLEYAETIVSKEGPLKDLLDESEIVSAYDLSVPTVEVRRQQGKAYWLAPYIKKDSLKGRKDGILQGAISSTVSVPKEIPSHVVNSYMSEIIEGYGGSVPESNQEGSAAVGGIYYEDTTMPDAFLQSKEGDLVGVVEVKSYSPEEFGLYVAKVKEKSSLQVFVNTEDYNKALGTDVEHYRGGINLGFDIEGEQRMLDILRDTTLQAEPMEITAPVLLRVPSDVFNEDIEAFSELCMDLGYDNVAVQKLPYTFEELDEIGKQVVRKVKEEFLKDRRTKFSNRELGILGEYAEVDFEE